MLSMLARQCYASEACNEDSVRAVVGFVVATGMIITAATALRRHVRERTTPYCTARISALYIHPVKSCAAIRVNEINVDECGLVHDREWAIVLAPTIVRPIAKLLTIREYPCMATLTPSLTSAGDLRLITPAGESLVVTPPETPALVETTVWRTTVYGADQGTSVGCFLASFLETSERVLLLRLVNPRRLVDCSKFGPLAHPRMKAGFSDWSSISLVSDESLRWLNAQIAPLQCDPRCFRMNVHVKTNGHPFMEEEWRCFRIGDVCLDFLKRTGRCRIPMIHPEDGKTIGRGEPLRTLKKRNGCTSPTNEAFIGINAAHRYLPGQRLCVGDELFVSS